MTRPRKQLLLKIGVFLLLGVVVNVAVAWGCTWTARPHSIASTDELVRWFEAFSRSDSEVTVLPTNAAGFGWLPQSDTDLIHFQVLAESSEKTGIKSLTLVEDATSAPGRLVFGPPPRKTICSKTLAGLPAYGLSNEQWTDFDAPYSTMPQSYGRGIIWPQRDFWSLAISREVNFLGTTGPQTVLLPLRPLWPGFGINTIFYAALLWVLFYGPAKIRRFVRIRRGCCPACGYKIAPGGGLGPRCSECGYELRKVEKSKVES